MKKAMILTWLFMSIAFMAAARTTGVFMEIHRKNKPEKHTKVDRMPMRVPVEVTYDSDSRIVSVAGYMDSEVLVCLRDESGTLLDTSDSINVTMEVPYGYDGIVFISIECSDWTASGEIEV